MLASSAPAPKTTRGRKRTTVSSTTSEAIEMMRVSYLQANKMARAAGDGGISSLGAPLMMLL
jgi:hypothetical protein